jgi:hypothetical protein
VKKSLMYIGIFLFSIIFVLLTSLLDGVKIEDRNEIQSTFPYEVGFPIPFVTLDYPIIDPPLPWTYKGNCCFRFYSWDKYWYSVIVTFIFLIVIIKLIQKIYVKFILK